MIKIENSLVDTYEIYKEIIKDQVIVLNLPISKFPIIFLMALFIFLRSDSSSCFAMESEKIFFIEQFNDLKAWKPLVFPKIKKHTLYSIVKNDGNSLLEASSAGSASGIILTRKFNVYNFPKVKWRWKVKNIYKNADALKKSGDDFPIRIYVIFDYEPEKAGFMEKAKYSAAKLLYGEYPPQSTLNFVWSSKKYDIKIITNPFTDKSKVILLDMGEEKVGEWQTHEIDIPAWYEEAFGKPSPEMATLAIMNDSDNTGEASISYVDFIEIYK